MAVRVGQMLILMSEMVAEEVVPFLAVELGEVEIMVVEVDRVSN